MFKDFGINVDCKTKQTSEIFITKSEISMAKVDELLEHATASNRST